MKMPAPLYYSVSPGFGMSKKSDWATPWPFFRLCEKRWGPFDLDVCATKADAKCKKFITTEHDSLRSGVKWRGRCWMNPPYGRGIGAWVEKAMQQAKMGNTVVALLPARTDTHWWHDTVPDAAEVHFLQGRITFEGAKSPGLFPSAVVVWRSRATAIQFIHWWRWKDEIA